MDPHPLFNADSPSVPIRGVHLDLKGLVPEFSHLLDLLSLFRKLQFNALVIEWEDSFPWTCDQRLQAPHAFSKEEVRTIGRTCDELGIEIIPLVQTLGHSENVLRLPGNEELREMPHRTDVFHPLVDRAPQTVANMVGDVLELLPDVKRFHLGGDEAYTLGENPASRAFVEKNGIAALYLRQLGPSLDILEAKGVRPMLWHDEIAQWDREEAGQIAARADIVVWGYTGDPRDETTYHHRFPQVEKLRGLGAELWGATAYKGADGPWADTPDVIARSKATIGWTEISSEQGLRGIFATGWSRYASGRIQVSPIDASLDSLAYTAMTLFNGVPPTNGIGDCISLLEDLGVAGSFQKTSEVLKKFSSLMNRCWDWIRQMEEQSQNTRLEPHRAHSGIEEIIVDLFGKDIEEAESTGREIDAVLRGKVVDPLPRLYWQARVNAIRDLFSRYTENAVPEREFKVV